MASPPIPPPLQHLATRPFSFYPPILNIEHNEWLFRKATWSEILVVNCKTSNEIWIPRRFLGEVSRIEDPVLIVGLNRELEYKAGAVWPYQRRVIEMPVAVGGAAPTNSAPAPERPERTGPAPVVGIRLESNDRRVFKLIGGAVAVGVALYVAAVYFNREGEPRARTVTFTTRDQSYLELNRLDNYTSTLQKLGQPTADRFRPDSGELKFRALEYKDRGYTVILMGPNQETATYIGTMDEQWKPVSPGDNAALLRTLKRF
jgi:hypothetical protein